MNKFEINSNPYTISNTYGGKDKTGLTPDNQDGVAALGVGSADQVVIGYNNEFLNKTRPFEAIEFGLSLNDLYEYYFSEKRKFAKGVFLDATNNESFILKKVKVQVSDVTEDYSRYVNSRVAAASKNKIVLEKDPGNNDVWNDTTASNPIISEAYELNTLNLKPEYQYKYTPGESLSEIFDFDTTIFSDRLKNSPEEVELVTTFHENFTGSLESSEQRILRVDYVIETTEENYTAQLEAFKWNSVINAANGVNSSLYESIRNTLQEVKPTGILYSYYLKLEPNSK